MAETRFLGNMNGFGAGYAGAVWDKNNISPTLTTMQGGGREPMIIEMTPVNKKIGYIEVSEVARVRKYEVDIEGLRKTLREHKCFTNKEIADKLNVPITKVEHWFRTDNHFAIPDEDIWMDLKKLLRINTDEFDASILEYEEHPQVFEKAQRLYLPENISPTILIHSGETRILEIEKINRENEMPKYTKESKVIGGLGEKKSNNGTQYYQQDRVYEMGDIAPCIPAQLPEGGNKFVEIKKMGNLYNQDTRWGVFDDRGVTPTLTASMGMGGGHAPMVTDIKALGNYMPSNYDASVEVNNVEEIDNDWVWNIDGVDYQIRIRKITPREAWRLMDFSDSDFEKAEATVSNTQLYKQAGNSIVKNVLYEAFRNLME